MNVQIPCALALLAALASAPSHAQDTSKNTDKKTAKKSAENANDNANDNANEKEQTGGRAEREDSGRSADATVYTFEDELVGGDTINPSLEVLTVRSRKDRQSLVRARESFVVELLQSVERL
jgi:hypothetical protein